MSNRLNITNIPAATVLNFGRLARFLGYTNAELVTYLVEISQLEHPALWQNMQDFEERRRQHVEHNWPTPRR